MMSNMIRRWLVFAFVLSLIFSTEATLVFSQANSSIEVNTLSSGSGWHNLVLQSDGTVWAWGDNFKGQLGIGRVTNSPAPVQVKDANDRTGYLTNVVAVARNEYSSLALKNDGTVWEWGARAAGNHTDNAFNLYNPSKVKAINDPTGYLSNITAIAEGPSHAIALRKNGTVWAWGIGSHGALGYRESTVLEARMVPNVQNVIAVAAGDGMTAMLKNDSTVWFCGDIKSVSDFTFSVEDVRPLKQSTTPSGQLSDVEKMYGGRHNMAFIKKDGSVWILNKEVNKNLVCSRAVDSSDPTGYLSGVKELAFTGVGYCEELLILKNDGNVYTMTGLDDGTFRGLPIRINGLENIVRIAAGSLHGMALKNDGTLWTWGKNSNGQLGNGSNVDSDHPILIKNIKIGAVDRPGDGLVLTEVQTGVKVVIAKGNRNSAEPVKLPVQYLTATDKVWSFGSNAPLKISSLNDANIYITDLIGRKVPSKVTCGSDGKSFKIAAKSKYVPCKVYFLNMKGIESSSGVKMNYSAILMFATENSRQAPDPDQGNTSGNLQNGGYAAGQGAYVYYANPVDGYRLYKIKNDNTGNIKLSNDKAECINIVNNSIYYKNTGDGALYKMGTDGKGKTMLIGKPVDSVTVWKSAIYYIAANQDRNNCLYKTDLNGKSAKLLINSMGNAYNLCVAGDYLYYRISGYNASVKGVIVRLYRAKLDGSEQKEIGQQVTYMDAVGDWFFTAAVNDKTYAELTDESFALVLETGHAKHINIDGNWIYYVNGDDNGMLYRIRTDGREKTRLSGPLPGEVTYINIVGDFIYTNLGKLKINHK